jgi:hypothetical protein
MNSQRSLFGNSGDIARILEAPVAALSATPSQGEVNTNRRLKWFVARGANFEGRNRRGFAQPFAGSNPIGFPRS